MMPNFLKVESDALTDAIVAEADFIAGLDGEWIEESALPEFAGIGWTRSGDVWSNPNAPAPLTDAEKAAPLEISERAFWDALRPALALKSHTVGLKPVRTWLEEWVVAHGSLTDEQKMGALDALQSTIYWRGDAHIATLGALLGFTSAEIDTLFIDAAEAS